jgi:2-(1,2-epoxy-1,2-dihydrophenyl)acetyl-CoA isomerase
LETIQYEVTGGVGTLTLNRPQRKNAIDAVMREELKEVVASMPRQRDLRALIITGAGATFCAGGDISVNGGGTLSPEDGRHRMRHDYLSWIETLLRLEILSFPLLRVRPTEQVLVWRSRQISFWLHRVVGFAFHL